MNFIMMIVSLLNYSVISCFINWFIIIITVHIQQMEQELQNSDKPIYYISSLDLFPSSDIQLLCQYKKFIEVVIMQLGEDWRIQSSLFTQQIIAIKNNQQQTSDYKDYSLFNQFLSSFLEGKANKEYQFVKISESQIQQSFLERVSKVFQEEEIKESLTFKTLSLGFCITASQIWIKTFKNVPEVSSKLTNSLKSFLKKSDHPIGQNSNSGWTSFQVQEIGEHILNGISNSLKAPKDISKAVVLSDLVCFIGEIDLKDKKIRIINLSNQFYVRAFIVWLIFSIKMFFSLNNKDYLKFCKDFFLEDWNQKFQIPLKSFQQILEQQWNKLLKDYTIALHDDYEVLRILIQRVRNEIYREWQSRLSVICLRISN